MLKGVNKQILEITNPESPYFEKIIFFVRPDSQGCDDKAIKTEAEKISTSTALRPPKQKRSIKRILLIALYVGLSVLCSACVAFLLKDFNVI